MTTSAPLRRPSTRRCATCGGQHPLGHFSEQISLDKDPQRWRRLEHDSYRSCRGGSRALPGRHFR